MERFPNSDKLVMFELEGTSGTGETPSGSTDAILAENPQFAITGGVDAGENEVTSSLDPGDPVPLGVAANCSFGVRLKGVAAPGVTPPRWGRLLQASGMLQTLTAADVTGTASAGTASSITTVGESAVDDAYKGMVIEITAGTGSGQPPVVITGYVGSTGVATVYPDFTVTPDNTSEYAIRASALYTPTSLDQKTATIWMYQNANQSAVNSILRKINGAVGSPTIEITNGGIARINLNFQGLLPEDPSDVARPSAPTYDSGNPQPFLAGRAYLAGIPVQFNRFTLPFNNQMGQPDDPAAANGLDYASITARRMDGNLICSKRLMATRNAVTTFKNSTSQKLWFNWGSGTGKRISLLLPDVRNIAPPTDETVNGFAYENLGIRANGRDSGAYLCVY